MHVYFVENRVTFNVNKDELMRLAKMINNALANISLLENAINCEEDINCDKASIISILDLAQITSKFNIKEDKELIVNFDYTVNSFF